MDEKNSCVACKSGEICWDNRHAMYACNTCDFELPFALEERLPTYFVRGKHFLGSFISYRRNTSSGKRTRESDLEQRLRVLHKNISTAEEWKRRKEHFEEQVRRAKKDVLAEWQVRIGKQQISELEKGRTVIQIADDFGLPVSTVAEVLVRSGKCKQAPFHVWDYKLNRKYGAQVSALWRTFRGNRATKSGNFVKISATIQKISERIGLNVYSTSQVIKRNGLCPGGNWALWQFEKLQEYGVMIGQLWDNRESRVKDDWTLCEVVDSISKDLKIDNPYFIINALASTGRSDLDERNAFTIYSKYKYAKLTLEFISKDGPKTISDIAKKFEISYRVAAYSLNILADAKLVKIHGGKNRIVYLSSQEQQLRKVATYLRLEDEIMTSQRLYVTSHEVMRMSSLSESKAEVLLNKWADEKKLMRLNDVRVNGEIIYVILDGQKHKDATRAVLVQLYGNVLKHIDHTGVTPYGVCKKLNSQSWGFMKHKLNILKKYGIISERDGKYYPPTK